MKWTPFVLAVALAAAGSAVSAADADDAINAGLRSFKKRNFAAAEADFQKAVDADPQSAAAHFYLGYTIYKRVEPKRPFHPDKQKAAEEFAKAFSLDPGFTPEWGKQSAVAKSPRK
jgi:Tfp pilus assembly protein PilF